MIDDGQEHHRYQPPGWRLAFALLLSPLPPIVLFALFWRGDQEGSPGIVNEVPNNSLQIVICHGRGARASLAAFDYLPRLPAGERAA